jgi:hypothetical protein
MTKRRDFIKKSILGAVGISIPGTNTISNPGLKATGDDYTLMPGHFLDAAPFSLFTAEENGKAHSLRWGEPRKIRRVVIEFPENSNLPKPDKIRLQYWHKSWNGLADPILAERGAGGEG